MHIKLPVTVLCQVIELLAWINAKPLHLVLPNEDALAIDVDDAAIDLINASLPDDQQLNLFSVQYINSQVVGSLSDGQTIHFTS